MNGEQKITGFHRERLAVVYLRQSSMAQVRDHAESTMRQYGLAGEAARLGWSPADVRVIDTDLGISGRFGVTREGFKDLVSMVCRGEVGAILGIEISRLARSNADVARLIEFARITGTLLIDSDGIYDPADVNDRMLLGLKSTMGEVELHVMAGRLQEAKRACAARGELRTPLPVGYVRDEHGEPGRDVLIDPDAEVQAGLGSLTAAQRALADFLRLDSGLLEVAAEASPALPAVKDDARALATHIAKLPVSDKDRLLVLVAEDQAARARMELLRSFRPDPDDQRGSGPRRTVAELLDTAGARRLQRE